MTNVNFQHIEELLLRLLVLLSDAFSGTEKDEVREFIDVGEYGLALETLVDVIDEEDKQIQEDVLQLVLEVATAMSLDEGAYRAKLSKHVTIS